MDDLFNLNKTRATRAKGTTTIMANNSKASNVTPETVAAQAAEENLVEKTVPVQGEGKKTGEKVHVITDVEEQGGEPELTVIEGGKKSLKDRVTAVAEKVKANQKTFIAVGIAAAAATVAVAKVVAKRSLEKELAKAEDENRDEVDQYEEIKDTAVASDETAA